MTGTPFVPLTADLIDEGRLLERLNEEIAKATAALVDYRREHGPRAHKAEAKVSLDIKLICTDAENGAYQINWGSKMTPPKFPTQSSFAVEGQTQDNRDSLFVRASGSDRSHPAQQKFCTEDGRDIDTETGQVRPE